MNDQSYRFPEGDAAEPFNFDPANTGDQPPAPPESEADMALIEARAALHNLRQTKTDLDQELLHFPKDKGAKFSDDEWQENVVTPKTLFESALAESNNLLAAAEDENQNLQRAVQESYDALRAFGDAEKEFTAKQDAFAEAEMGEALAQGMLTSANEDLAAARQKGIWGIRHLAYGVGLKARAEKKSLKSSEATLAKATADKEEAQRQLDIAKGNLDEKRETLNEKDGAVVDIQNRLQQMVSDLSAKLEGAKGLSTTLGNTIHEMAGNTRRKLGFPSLAGMGAGLAGMAGNARKNFTVANMRSFLTWDRASAFAVGAGTSFLLHTALTPLGLGVLSGAGLSIYRSVKQGWDNEITFGQNVRTALSQKSTWKKAGIAAAFGIAGVGVAELFQHFSWSGSPDVTTADISGAPAKVAELPAGGDDVVVNTCPDGSTKTICDRLPGARDATDIDAAEVRTGTDIRPAETVVGKDVEIVPRRVETIRVDTDGKIIAPVVEAPKVVTEILDANTFLNGDVAGHDDMSLVNKFIEAGHGEDIDTALIEKIKAKMEGADFIMSADAIRIVETYTAELAKGLAEDGLSQEEYHSALKKVLETLASDDTNFVKDVAGQIDDTESYTKAAVLAAREKMTAALTSVAKFATPAP